MCDDDYVDIAQMTDTRGPGVTSSGPQSSRSQLPATATSTTPATFRPGGVFAAKRGRFKPALAAVEPENRTVARELERRWNERLAEVENLRARAARGRDARRPLNERELARAQQLGRDLEAVWNAPTTTVRDRKLLLRALIEEVQIRTEEKLHRVRIVWKGGATCNRDVVRRKGGQYFATDEETVELVRKLATEFDDAQIARILNRQGRRSGLGLAFTKSSILSLRGKNRIPVCPHKLAIDARQGPFTADEAARELGVTQSTIHRWLRDGVIAGTQATARAPWRILITDEVRARIAGGSAPDGWVGLEEAARRLGRGKALVAHWVKEGKLRGMRVKVGKRECWKIDVTSGGCEVQKGLFDQISNVNTRES